MRSPAPGRSSAGRVIWHVNSTAKGGGVAELLQSLLAYARGAGVDVRWLTISGNPEFFRLTKRLHNHLHESAGDGGRLGPEERRIYDDALAEAAAELFELVRPGDVVYIHDPQPAGLLPHARGQGHQHDLALPRRGGPAGEARARGLGIPPPLRGRGGRIRLLPEGVRLGRSRDRTSLDRPSVDRRVLPEEPGPRAGCGRRHPGRCRHPAGGSLQSRSLPPIRREQRARRSCRPA